MGLDMFLYKVKREEVAYWRKANAIHAWFERNVADGEIENCKEYPVSKEDLLNLRSVCTRVLHSCRTKEGMVKNGATLRNGIWEDNYEAGKVIENPEVAEELLPSQSGFFFGSTNYDSYYLEDLQNTVEQIDEVLATTDFDKEDLVYYAWW